MKMNSLFLDAAPVRLQARTDLHLARKAWHMIMGLFIVCMYATVIPKNAGVVILVSFLIWDLAMEGARLRFPAFNEKVLRVWGPLMRSSERNKMSAIPHYIAASAFAIGVFPKHVAILSILYLACGDPLASLAGILYGDRGHRFQSGKSVIGTGAGVLTCTVLTFVYLKAMGLQDSTSALVALIGGFVGGTVELLPVDMDDNFTIPVVSGFALWLISITVGI